MSSLINSLILMVVSVFCLGGCSGSDEQSYESENKDTVELPDSIHDFEPNTEEPEVDHDVTLQQYRLEVATEFQSIRRKCPEWAGSYPPNYNLEWDDSLYDAARSLNVDWARSNGSMDLPYAGRLYELYPRFSMVMRHNVHWIAIRVKGDLITQVGNELYYGDASYIPYQSETAFISNYPWDINYTSGNNKAEYSSGSICSLLMWADAIGWSIIDKQRGGGKGGEHYMVIGVAGYPLRKTN